MNRIEAIALVQDKIQNKNLFKHMLAVEAIMRSLARNLGEDEETWGLCGLVHDYDYEETLKDFSRHGIVTQEQLAGKIGVDIAYAVRAHTGLVERKSLMDKAIYCADPVSGFIVAAALVLPDKKLSAVKVENLLNRFKEKHFAKGASRPQMESCSDLNMTLEEFLSLSLSAMQAISGELGL